MSSNETSEDYRALDPVGPRARCNRLMPVPCGPIMSGTASRHLVIGKILNHVEPGMTKVYDRHSYDGRSGRHCRNGNCRSLELSAKTGERSLFLRTSAVGQHYFMRSSK